ncbi:Uncharacterised protein [Vibrio cholerae]|uniref:Uncharacterized protein n=1 Tax=Vibrio cholerae TaxID=666 RepID=A0A655ZLT5_VIBCL|nr:Uncharacterised protein [Vibrio cholerae]CSC76083.1 Uncharacterised protein [Vibrio cholerae]
MLARGELRSIICNSPKDTPFCASRSVSPAFNAVTSWLPSSSACCSPFIRDSCSTTCDLTSSSGSTVSGRNSSTRTTTTCSGATSITSELRPSSFTSGDFSACSTAGVVNTSGACSAEIKSVCTTVAEIALAASSRESECSNAIFSSSLCLA